MKSYQKIKFLLSASILCLLFVNSSTAIAGVCDESTGKEYGICIAATEGARCGSIEPSATSAACKRVTNKYIEASGASSAPWEILGFEVEIYIDKVKQYFGNNDFDLSPYGTIEATATQATDGSILFKLTDTCELAHPDDGCYANVTFRSAEQWVPKGTAINIKLLNNYNLPVPTVYNANGGMDYTFAICQVAHLDADGDGGGETLLINLADKENKIDSLGDHIVVTPVDGPIRFHCFLSTGGSSY